MFVVNEQSEKHKLEIVAITKNKEGMIFQFNLDQNRFDPLREKFLLPDIPITAAFVGKFFYLGIAKKSYQLINLEDK